VLLFKTNIGGAKSMEIKTFGNLIEWTRIKHAELAKCLTHAADKHPDQRTAMLLHYLASQEARLDSMVTVFQDKADPKALDMYAYDMNMHNPITTHMDIDDHYVRMSADEIREEVFGFHDQIAELFRAMIAKAEIPEASDLLREFLDMEVNESKLLVRQTERMNDM
tara:strand:- start:1106 stop:1603 length:498 start_codon:yes stop_codon:yes gene_type:complete